MSSYLSICLKLPGTQGPTGSGSILYIDPAVSLEFILRVADSDWYVTFVIDVLTYRREDFLRIPELAINPLGDRIVHSFFTEG